MSTKTLLPVLTLEVDYFCFAFGFFGIEITCCILLSKHIFCSVSSFCAIVGYSDNWSFLISPPQIIWSFPISPLQQALLNLLLLILSLIIHPRLWQIFDCLFFFFNSYWLFKKNSCMIRAKLGSWYRDFPCTPHHHTCIASPFIDIPHQNSRFCYNW